MNAPAPAVTVSALPPAIRAQRRAAAAIAVLALAALAATLPTAPRTGAGRLVSDAARLRLDPNTATVAELALLPDLGPVRAARIVAYRDSQTARPVFGGPDDLRQVTGIGPIIANRLRPHLSFPPTAPDAGDRP